ncbi:MAG: UDP-3-O-(3-hydroxymyristoyl)glucosamine N-acyltransferase [Rickettsiales bacterium]|jgi:UDP-3-O-[3-hydroxymyristoyl] glucosamine N-acyltransferase|nr:UDP-3-O-(3-hydroxymyristoyl)glucosamine N-acyltransferase [Rickettsiales bacterium]
MKKLLRKLFGPRARKTTAGEIAKRFGLKVRGDAKTKIEGIAPIADAKAGDASFYSTERNSTAFKILPLDVLKNTKASTILLQPENAGYAPAGATLLISEHPRADVVKIMDFLYSEPKKRGISLDAIIARGVFFRRKRSVYIAPFAVIERGASIEENAQIMSGAYIGRNCRIGKNTIVHANAVIENATIGDDCVIHSGAAIGKDGFGYTRQNGKNIFIPHAGRVILGNRVSVGANSCIDRGALTDTQIGDGTKIDNLVQIAHGVIIGKECFAAAGVGIAGGCVIGDRVLMGGHVGISNGIKIGDDAEIGAQSGILRDIPAGEKWLGYPAYPAMEYLRMMAWLKNQTKKGTKKEAKK